MTLPPGVIVDAPASRGLRYGLFTAAGGPLETLEGHALADGVRYKPGTCGTAILRSEVCGVNTPAPSYVSAIGYVSGAPFTAEVAQVCGSVGTSFDAISAEVRQILQNGEQTVAEQGMTAAMTGAVPVTAYDPLDIRSVIGALEQWLYGSTGVNYGNVGLLHMPARYAIQAGAHGALIQKGPLWTTHMGTVVSFGGGYPDLGPIYITGHATVWREPAITVIDPAQTFDRQANQHYAVARRTYVVAYDCHAAVAQYTPIGES